MNNLGVCLWFDGRAEEAVAFYEELFGAQGEHAKALYDENSARQAGQAAGKVMTVTTDIRGLSVLALNGGPMFKFTPSLSLFVGCQDAAEINRLWAALSKGGKVRMDLAKQEWAELYGWCADRFGVEWQLIVAPGTAPIAPAMLFTDELYGRGQEALDFYLSVFPLSQVESLMHEANGKTVAHAAFTLHGQRMVLMEGAGKHGHQFNEATSIVISCDTQDEIDFYWYALTRGGTPSRCGWLKDKFGVSWQIVPRKLKEIMSSPDRTARVMKELMKMEKLDLAQLEYAANS